MARNFENAPDMSINRLVEGTKMEGDLQSESNIRIDGIFSGNIRTKGRLVVGPTGHVEGTVTCENAEIEGYINGKITINQLLNLKASAKVEGDIFTDKLSIEPGATFTGTCSMGAKVKDLKNIGKTVEEQPEEFLEKETA
jgi:cytoskeletal protein CcmA (bactofilin family)